MPQAYCVKIVAMLVSAGLKLAVPILAALFAVHFNPSQLGALIVHPLGWGKNPLGVGNPLMPMGKGP